MKKRKKKVVRVRRTSKQAPDHDRTNNHETPPPRKEKVKELPGSDAFFPKIEPWPEPVDGGDLLDELEEVFATHVALPAEAGVALSLWVLHTHTLDAAQISPRLAITSPSKRCGKTTTLDILNETTSRPLKFENATTAVIFRTVDACRPTLLIDEADTFLTFASQLRGVLNSGHRKDGKVPRLVGDQFVTRFFRTYAAVAIAAIGRLPDTIMDRSIVIRMKRRMPHEIVMPLGQRERQRFVALRRRIVRWAADNVAELPTDPERPDIDDRAGDNWTPLLAIADHVGGDWPSRARAAAVSLSRERQDVEHDGTIAEQLLVDIHAYFVLSEADEVSTKSLLDHLHKLDGRVWSEASRGRPLTGDHLARLLRHYGITPKQMRFGREIVRGYRRESFADAFDRYLPRDPVTPATATRDGVTPVTETSEKDPVREEPTKRPKKKKWRVIRGKGRS